jgi:hypothetical protein
MREMNLSRKVASVNVDLFVSTGTNKAVVCSFERNYVLRSQGRCRTRRNTWVREDNHRVIVSVLAFIWY